MAFEIFLDNIYPEAYVYKGPAEECSFDFSVGPEQLDFVQGVIVNYLIHRAAEAVEEHGGKILRVTAWRDTAPVWTTPYWVTIQAHSSPAVLFWVAIIALIFLLLAIAIAYIVHEVKDIEWFGKGEWLPGAAFFGAGLLGVIAGGMMPKEVRKPVGVPLSLAGVGSSGYGAYLLYEYFSAEAKLPEPTGPVPTEVKASIVSQVWEKGGSHSKKNI